MKNILLINGSKNFGHSKGELNNYLSEVCEKHLNDLGLKVKKTMIDSGYDINNEIDKILWSDVIIYQMAAWWMGVPWIVKKYIDEVFTIGHGKLYLSDGRSRGDISKKYGSGGLLHSKKYMLSITWNAPEEAFLDKDQLFEGVGIDGVYLPVHKAHQFLGMTSLPTFMCNDVMKNPRIESDVLRYRKHLDSVFKLVRA
ncbi:NAD(P)H-dependent oxidoreductase [Cysteiniphilum halobium]|uniref:NAD(P)H-dependent oxidoreductase n=1 Tax=Cysteiniphilum halobium TaxID=2219059 RepID=UPI000E65A896|nr:NAD(P)H-dependent oxidoreductase [Cysteiniphilum halobium]